MAIYKAAFMQTTLLVLMPVTVHLIKLNDLYVNCKMFDNIYAVLSL